MGTLAQFFQPPLYWQQFEDLTQGLLGEVYSVPNAQQVGRAGQAQDGVDVFGKSSRYGQIGIQCKRLTDLDKNNDPLPGGPIDKNFLEDAANEALAFKPDLQIWILATTAKRDAKIQGLVRSLNERWTLEKRDRQAIVWAWDDCVSYLNAFPDLQNWYYRDVIKVRSVHDLDIMILETISMSFHRPAFEVPINCEQTDEFVQALKDTQKALRTGELVDRESRHVIRKAVAGWRGLENPYWRDGLREVDGKLRMLRSQLQGGLKVGIIQQQNGFLNITDNTLLRRLEGLRSDAIRILNPILKDAKIDMI
ncbi:hypothetical protein IV417_18560 [Alphaproteobacteria bacterium KMM 3653]|uniref:Uncharacterized protein n=1 Tax=Harenicola maris TaxID=2841044 RepID=A0AAP2G5X2_9RHOB|nr:hypothetical protein [Harenicola maris]